MITGKSSLLYENSGCDHHGTSELKYIYEWINKFRSKGHKLNDINQVLPFLNFKTHFIL